MNLRTAPLDHVLWVLGPRVPIGGGTNSLTCRPRCTLFVYCCCHCCCHCGWYLHHRRFPQKSKLVRTNQNRSGKTSVDRSAKTTLSTYNAWIYLSQLRTIHHIYTYACLIVYTTCSGRVVSQAKGPSLKLPSLVEAVTNNT